MLRRAGKARRLLLIGVSAVAIALVAAACSGGAAPVTDRAAPATQAHTEQGAARIAAPPSPTNATLQLEALLGQHSVLVADMMRGRLRGDPDFAQAANAALGKNTDALGSLVGALLGDEVRARFATLWSAHVSSLFNYARGLADHDDAVRRDARTALTRYESSLGGLFAGASQGRLPPATAVAALRMHVDHLLQQADAYAAADYGRSNELYRIGYTHTYQLGKALAVALLGPGPAAALNAPAWTLRSELSRLLGEHVALVVAAMRSGAVNGPDFTAAGAAVNGNTRDLAGAVDTLFGAAAARQFQSLWADHVDALMRYTAGVVAGDAARRRDARARLDRFQRGFAAFLGTATGHRMALGDLAQALLMHDQMLVRQVDAYAAKNYQVAHDLAYTTYQQMVGLAGQLADAFGARVTARAPRGAPETGRGGTATAAGHH